MCGIIVSNKCIDTIDPSKLKRRGPDSRTCVSINGIHFIHYLLHMTGHVTTQPFVSDDNLIVALYNGEIYNYKDLYPTAKSDGECIIPTYTEHGPTCIKKFDGEFAIVIFDFKKQLLIISSDVFRTKPLFYHVSNNNIVISSYLSVCTDITTSLDYTIVSPNTILVYDLNTCVLKETHQIFTFDIRQYKTTLDDWENAFETAVLKRYSDTMRPLVFLSSGLDSGAICCCLHKYNKSFLAVSVPSNENIEVLHARKKLYGDMHDIIEYHGDKNRCNNYLRNNCESHFHTWEKYPVSDMIEDGCNGAKVFIMEHARKKIHTKLAFSGIGADEIMNTHAQYDRGNRGQVDFFPDNLEDVFPWRNFYEGSMKNYLLSDEYVAGSMGYETRYPFLDKQLVQEFLYLTPQLKNKMSKYPLVYYLEKYNNPYTTQKFGFNTQ